MTSYRRDAGAMHDRITARLAAKPYGPRSICAWCGWDMGPARPGATKDSHGICPRCDKKHFPQAHPEEANQ